MSAPERVLVTGASRGIGRAIATLLIARGANVAALARDRGSLEDLGAAVILEADLARLEGPRGLIDRAAEALGGLDGLVHCAGNADHRPLAEIDETQIDAHLAIHVRAPLILARDLAARAPSGSIVLLGSTLGLQGAAGTCAYAAAKGAVIAMTRTLAIELAPRIRVNCVAPGAVDTELIAPRGPDLAHMHPLGRIASAREIAATIAHVLDAPFMTGSIVTIDGGLTAG